MHNLRCCINILKIRIGMSDIWQIPRRSLHSYGNLYVTKSELQHQALEVKHVVFSGSLCDQIYFSPSHGLTSAAIHKSKIYSRFTSIRQLMLANLKATPFRVLKCGNKYPEHHNIRCLSRILHHENHVFDSKANRTFNTLNCVLLIKDPQHS